MRLFSPPFKGSCLTPQPPGEVVHKAGSFGCRDTGVESQLDRSRREEEPAVLQDPR